MASISFMFKRIFYPSEAIFNYQPDRTCGIHVVFLFNTSLDLSEFTWCVQVGSIS